MLQTKAQTMILGELLFGEIKDRRWVLEHLRFQWKETCLKLVEMIRHKKYLFK